MSIPRYDDLYNPLLEAIKRLGGSASISELDEEVTKNLNLSDKEIAQMSKDGRRTELQYRLAWVRTYLKAYGLLDNSGRGVWVLTSKGKDIDAVDPRQVVRFVQSLKKGKNGTLSEKNKNTTIDVEVTGVAEAVLEETWREELLARLLDLPPRRFRTIGSATTTRIWFC